MITTEGNVHIKRYLAGWEPRIAASIAFGIGEKPENIADTALEFETERADISLTSYDFVSNQLVFKTNVPERFSGKIYEVGLYSNSVATANQQFGSKIISTFDSETEEWLDYSNSTPATYTSSNVRIGIDGITSAPALSATKAFVLNNIFTDLSEYSGSDNFVVSYFVGSNVANIKIRFLVNTTNYFEFTITSPTPGYKISTLAKSSASVTGNPSWGEITSIYVSSTSTGGGASQVVFDGLRIQTSSVSVPGRVLVAREVLSAPVTKEIGRSQSIEFMVNA